MRRGDSSIQLLRTFRWALIAAGALFVLAYMYWPTPAGNSQLVTGASDHSAVQFAAAQAGVSAGDLMLDWWRYSSSVERVVDESGQVLFSDGHVCVLGRLCQHDSGWVAHVVARPGAINRPINSYVTWRDADGSIHVYDFAFTQAQTILDLGPENGFSSALLMGLSVTLCGYLLQRLGVSKKNRVLLSFAGIGIGTLLLLLVIALKAPLQPLGGFSMGIGLGAVLAATWYRTRRRSRVEASA